MTISVTRALAEIKSLNDRIAEATGNGIFVAVTKGLDDRTVAVSLSGVSISDLSTKISASYQKVVDLLDRRTKLKAAVLRSNSIVTVTIAGQTMTIAEAIERKNSIELYRNLLATLRHQRNKAASTIEQGMHVLNEAIEKAVTQAYGNDKGKVTAEQYDAVAGPRRKEHELRLLDPQDIDAKIESLTDSINSFLLEVDFALSESNARTELDV